MKRLSNENYHDVASGDYLDMLHNILPPQVVIHIGAGNGEGELHHWKQWGVPHALIIDADVARLEWANASLAGHPGWHVVDAVVSDISGETDFYQATNPSEDSLIPAENLAAIWPNLRTVAQTSRPVIRLDTLLAEQRYSEFRQSNSIWTIVDCLPALPILQGAGDDIAHWSVLCLRVLLKPLAAIEEYATLQAIESFLEPLGYRCIHVTEGNHPAIGIAIFVRDWQTVLNQQIEQLTQIQVDQVQLAGDRYIRIELLTSEMKVQAQQLADCQTQIEVLTKDKADLHEEKSVLTEQCDTLQSEVAVLMQARDEQAKLAGDRYLQIDALVQEKATLAGAKAELIAARDAQAKLAADRQGQIVQLTQARDEQTKLAGDRYIRIESLTSELEAQAQQLADRQTQIEVMTNDSADLHEEKLALIQQRDVLQSEVASLMQARDEQAKLAGARHTQIQVLTQEKTALIVARDAQGKLAAERQIQIAQLTQARDEAKSQLANIQAQLVQANQAKTAQVNLVAEQTQLANSRKADLDITTQTLQEKDARIIQLEATLVELENRQRLIDEEMIKAEAQIGLIKDVLLREPGL